MNTTSIPGRAEPSLSIRALLATAAASNLRGIAIAAPGRSPLTHAQLQAQLHRLAASLSSAGIGRADRVATLLPNGPDTAVLSLAVMSGATLAPLNPELGNAEAARYLAELRATALIVPADLDSPAIEAAQHLGLALLRLRVDTERPAGVFDLQSNHGQAASAGQLATADDVALLLHTSGTTSRPKIVPLTHRNLCLSAASIARSLALAPGDTCLSVMPLFHVHGLIGALLASLAAGAGVICTRGFVATRFFDWLEEFSPTWYTAVPTMHQAILARAQGQPAVIARRRLRFIRSSSAALPIRVADELAATFGAPVIEAYGMTEAAHQVATAPLPPGVRRAGSVGMASGPALSIVDTKGQTLDTGCIGEIVVRGASVMAGYENAPRTNAATFIGDWLRTGDQGFLDNDGYLFITGRLKELINRGGEKIAPREIDEVLLEHPAVAQAIAFALPHPKLGEEVAAAVVLRSGETVQPKDLRAFVGARLAAFKVPRVLRILDEIPRGPTGKPQRMQLAQLLDLIDSSPSDQPDDQPRMRPGTPVELTLAEVWSSVLRVDLADIGRADSFFDLGGDSVLAAQLVARLAPALGIHLGLLDVFEQPTLEGLAGHIERRRSENGTGSPPEIPRWSGDAPAPLSFGEERTWWSDQLAADHAINHRPMAWRLEGPLDVAALRFSLRQIVRRHTPLRSTFPSVAGEVTRLVSEPSDVDLDLPIVDLRDHAPDERPRAAAGVAAEQIRTAFDLDDGPLLRAVLLQLGAAEHVLLIVVHHIAFDAWSENVLGRELGEIYSAQVGGPSASLPELKIQYADFAAWQRDRLSGDTLATQLDSWRRRLAGAPPTLHLPTDHPRPASPSGDTDQIAFTLPPQLVAALEGLGRQADATLFMTLLGAFNVLLARYSEQDDILVGAPLSGRVAPETEPLIGFFVNTLVLRTDLSDDPTFRELLARVRRTCLDAYATQEVPFERLVAELETERIAGRNPLVQVLCNLRNSPSQTPWLHGLTTSVWPVRIPSSPFDLSLDMTPTSAGLDCALTYSAELFDAASMQSMARHFRTLLDGIVRNPNQSVSAVSLLTPPERVGVLQASSAPRLDPAAQPCVHELFEAQAAAQPEALAVIAGDEQLTYARLDRRANRLAGYLRRSGAGPETRIGVFLERTPELIVALLGILKAGAAYVPLDPALPAERLAYVLRDAAVSLLVTRDDLASRLAPGPVQTVCFDRDRGELAQESSAGTGVHVSSGTLAYVLYTSGSTGAPNGVLVEHGSLSNLIQAVTRVYRLDADDRVLQFASIGFDASAEEIFSTLASGATLVLRPNEPPQLVARFVNACADEALSVLNLPTAYWHVVVDSMTRDGLRLPAGVRLVVIGGEAARPDCLAAWHHQVGARIRLINAYGPTEATVTSTLYEVPAASSAMTLGSVPIGRPIANTSAYVLDRRREPVPPGVPGELYLGGRGLARGYVNQPELTAHKFLANPFDGGDERLYHTGDRVRLLADGNLVFLGRTDQQVKLRGFRIEPAEIEAALRLHPSIRDAVVVLDGEANAAERRLVAYLVGDAEPPAPSVVREFLRIRLPEYMLPAAYVPLDQFPVLPNGKIDRRYLPPPDWSIGACAAMSPRTPLEHIVADVLTEVLRVDRIGVHDNFFALGGHSLLAAQVASQLGEALGLELSVRTIFDAPSIASLAAAILERAADDVELATVTA